MAGVTPRPNLIKKCPACGALLRIATLGSGNTFGARYWTDGKMHAPMLPGFAWLRVCPADRMLFWVNEVEQLGEQPVWGAPVRPEWENRDEACDPKRADFKRALQEGLAAANADKERYLRIQLWWAANDPLRKKKRTQAEAWKPADFDNLRALEPLLSDERVETCVMRAEVLRELGRFDEAMAALPAEAPSELNSAVDAIRRLAQARNRDVAELK